MFRTICTFGLALGCTLAAVDELNAQGRSYRPPIRASDRPKLSPYLNLLNNNNSLEFNYFMRVRPELQLRQGQAQIQQSLQGVQNQLNRQNALIQSGLGTTGHTTSFLNTGGYFSGGGTGVGRGLGAQAPVNNQFGGGGASRRGGGYTPSFGSMNRGNFGNNSFSPNIGGNSFTPNIPNR